MNGVQSRLCDTTVDNSKHVALYRLATASFFTLAVGEPGVFVDLEVLSGKLKLFEFVEVHPGLYGLEEEELFVALATPFNCNCSHLL